MSARMQVTGNGKDIPVKRLFNCRFALGLQDREKFADILINSNGHVAISFRRVRLIFSAGTREPQQGQASTPLYYLNGGGVIALRRTLRVKAVGIGTGLGADSLTPRRSAVWRRTSSRT